MNDTITQMAEDRFILSAMTVADVKFAMANHPLWDVEFLKKDGTVRRMIATRDWKFLEENAGEMDYEKPAKAPTWNAFKSGYVRVWNCNELGWRVIPTGERLMRLDRID